MALTPFVRNSQGRVAYSVKAVSTNENVSQARVVYSINFPTVELAASQARVTYSVRESNPIQVSQARVVYSARGRIDNFNARAWTYTIDGHDFYILHMGQTGTLVYDTLTQQWMSWDGSNTDIPNWRASLGCNWNSANNVAFNSDVVVGDDLTGMLYYLDPFLYYDGDPYDPTATTQAKFTRVVTGGIPARGRGTSDCNFVFLTASFGEPLMGSQVTLNTSDDLGKTWTNNGYITIDAMDWEEDVSWSSLGSFGTPGRIFQIVDDGAFERIDSLDMA